MKKDRFEHLHAEIEQTNFNHHGKPIQKKKLDDWISEALGAIEDEGADLTPWEIENLREAIAANFDGLYWKASAALYRLTMPAAPAVAWSQELRDEIAQIDFDMLRTAAEVARAHAFRQHPIFMR